MRRWLPHPLLAATLWLAWLLLQRSLAPGTLLLGAGLALPLSWLYARLQPPAARWRKPALSIRLGVRVLGDIVRSNLTVAWIIITGRAHQPGFVAIPLQLEHPWALAALACIITATPGTIWVSHDSDRRLLLIHVLDLGDEAAWVASIKARYEQPLLEIFS